MRPVRAQFRDKSRDACTCGDSEILSGKKQWLQCEWPIIFVEHKQISVIKTAPHRLFDQVVVLEVFPAVGKTAFPKSRWHIASVLKDKHMAARQSKLGSTRVGGRARRLSRHQ